MTALLAITSPTPFDTHLPALVDAAGDRARIRGRRRGACACCGWRLRRIRGSAVTGFLAWCESTGVCSITEVQPLHVATWIEIQTKAVSAPTVKQALAAIRHLFDWLVTGQIVPVNPASSASFNSESWEQFGNVLSG
jgi:hypothetical protein